MAGIHPKIHMSLFPFDNRYLCPKSALTGSDKIVAEMTSLVIEFFDYGGRDTDE